MPSTTSEEDLKTLFKDVRSLSPSTAYAYTDVFFLQCGVVREVKITPLPNNLVATVEFMERDSVPAALTKDKKRIHDEEISVHLAWQSTLYVTNFPESADDAFIRTLFGKVGAYSKTYYRYAADERVVCSTVCSSTSGGRARSSKIQGGSAMYNSHHRCVPVSSNMASDTEYRRRMTPKPLSNYTTQKSNLALI